MDSNKTSFYLLTDTHFVSKKSWVEGEPINGRERGDQIALKASPEILDEFIKKIIADTGTDTVIFTGDNVNNGDMLSHYDFRERLERLRAAGKKVYVTTATHDYCSPNNEDECFQKNAVRYTETGTEPIEAMLRSGLYEFYEDYGPKQAISVHKESSSYTVKLCEGVRMVMINDNGNGRSHCGLFEDGVEWLRGEIAAAKEAGDFVLLAVHHPVIAPFEVYRHMVDYEMYGGYRELSELMCENNVRVVFTGHTHVQNIREYKSEKGGSFYDVSTIALVNAAGKMRKVDIDVQNGKCEIVSIGIDKLDGIDLKGESVYKYLYHLNTPGAFETLIPLAAENYDEFLVKARGFLPVDKLGKHRLLGKWVFRKLNGAKLKFIMRFGRTKKMLTPEQREQIKNESLTAVLFEILRCIFPGNAPYTPDTAENIVISGAARRLDRIVNRFKIKKVLDMIPPGSSLEEMAQDFLYNDRTGDDDSITINLR